ncbi:MAG: hypothetical protein LUQ35_01730 [Methanoregula sp.]|nr:hypothetical protein [Methanoregula sp.]
MFCKRDTVEDVPLDPVEGFIDGDLNTAAIMEPLDNMGDKRSGQVIVHDLVIRPQVRIDLFFPEHAIGNFHIGRCDTGEDSFPDLRA